MTGHRLPSARRVAATIIPLVVLLPSVAGALEPQQVDQHFAIDPITDTVLTGGGLGFDALLGLILSTGEIKANAPPTGSDKSMLLPIDRLAVDQTIDPNASLYSNIGLYAAVGFAALDPLLSGFRDGWDAALVDAMMYAQSLSLTLAFTDVTKIAVRRPRPSAYSCGGSCTSTDLDLSFFSGHSSTVADVAATATYLAFVRSPHTARPWITLIAGTLLTSFVSYERVRAGAHFPTDVIAGSAAGAAIGVLVPHMHRHETEQPATWVGLAPAQGGGGTVNVQGIF